MRRAVEVGGGETTLLRMLEDGCGHLGLEIARDRLELLVVYCLELQRWAKKSNLIAKKQRPEQIIENHFLDSLLLSPYLLPKDSTLMDVGSGAGFPGLVCKAVLPKLHLTMVEPRLKRVSFLRHIVRTLGLENSHVISKRIEELTALEQESAFITSRAVADIGDFLQMVNHLAGEKNRVLCMKGPKWREELNKAEPFLESSPFRLVTVDEMQLPFSGASRAVLCFEKSKR